MDIKDDVTIKSWDGTWTYRPKVLVTPQTRRGHRRDRDDVVRFPSPVRPAGSMHSTARMNGDDGGTMVDMKAMNRILKFGEDTVTVEGGVSYQIVSNALKERGLQFHVTTEIGNVTLGAMATAATKDSSFPGDYGQISSYVTAVRFVTPQGDIREINERDHPEEMQSHPLELRAVRHRLRGDDQGAADHALGVRHYSLSLEEFRKHFPVYKARGYAVMYYIFPYARACVVELRKDNPEAEPKSRRRWAYRNRFWRKYGPAVTPGSGTAPTRTLCAPRRQSELLFAAPGARARRAQRRHLAARPASSTIRATRAPTNICSACGRSARAASSRSSRTIAISASPMQADRVSLRPAERRLFDRADRDALLSYCWEGATLSIDPASTGGPEWEDFLQATTTSSVATRRTCRCSTRRRS